MDRGDKVALAIGLAFSLLVGAVLFGYFSLLAFTIARKARPFRRMGRDIRESIKETFDPGISLTWKAFAMEENWQAAYDAGEYRDALDELESAPPIYLGESDNESAARVYNNLGCTYHRRVEPAVALEKYLCSLDQYYAAGYELSDCETVLANIGLVREEWGAEWTRMRLLESRSEDDVDELLAAVSEVAATDEPSVVPVFEPYDPEKTMATFRRSADSLLNAGDTVAAATHLDIVGYYFTGEENLDSALACHRRAHALRVLTDADPVLVAGGRVAIAGTFASFGMQDSALAEYLAAHDIYAAAEDPDLACWGAWWLQNCLEQLGEERFLEVCRGTGRDASEAAALLRLARDAELPSGG